MNGGHRGAPVPGMQEDVRDAPVPPAFPLEPEGAATPRGGATDPAAFAEQLESETVRSLAHMGEQAKGPRSEEARVSELLGSTLRDAIEAAELAALWMNGEPDLELKLGLARQVGDEAKHYRFLGERLRQLGAAPDAAELRARGTSATFRYLKGLQTPAERLAAAGVREGIARVRNAILAGWCESRGDAETARLYREVIGPDDARHQEFVRRMLPRFALTAEDQERARRAAARTLQLAEDLAELARLRQGIAQAPGS